MRGGDADHEPGVLLAATEARRRSVACRLDPDKRVKLGQFFTPEPVADLLVRLVDIKPPTLRVLDPGAGVGSLTASLVARILRESPETVLEVTTFEIDPELAYPLRQTLDHCRALAGDRLRTRQRSEDFIRWASHEVAPSLLGVEGEQYDLVLMNPPYHKIGSSSAERRLLATAGIETTNLYSAFLLLARMLLVPTGQLVAITPRSFCNGAYFRRFRKAFLEDMTLTAIHLLQSRNKAFAGDHVLQENVVFAATKGAKRSTVTLSTSDGHDDDLVAVREVAHDDVVRPDDPDSFIHIVSDEGNAAVTRRMSSLTCSLGDLGLTVSTGRVVDFRARDYLRMKPDASTVPLIYQGHVKTGEVRWPSATIRKPQHFVRAPEVRSQLLPAGYFVLTKRFSAKEERRRVVAGVFDPARVPCTEVAFENHTNVIHRGNRG